MTLGEKIRTLRLAQGKTQAALGGECITRNMLCQIERDKATPSLPTLLHLAEALEVPVAYFFEPIDSIEEYRRELRRPELRRLFTAGNYAEALALGRTLLDPPDDEIAWLAAQAAYLCGVRAFEGGRMETASAYLNEALGYLDQTVYPTADLFAKCRLYATLAENPSAPRRNFDEAAYIQNAYDAVEWELFNYMTDRADFPFRNSLYADHQKARRLMQENFYEKAYTVLLSLEERKTDRVASTYFLFRLYSDLETCCRERGDFEGAYRYSAKRLNQLSAFRS